LYCPLSTFSLFFWTTSILLLYSIVHSKKMAVLRYFVLYWRHSFAGQASSGRSTDLTPLAGCGFLPPPYDLEGDQLPIA
jgi:hypothetical protein